VATLAVEDPRPIVRTAPAGGGVVVAGDGEGIVDLAAAGLLDGRLLEYAADVAYMRGSDDVLPREATYVVTDTNRMRARRWGTVRENVGYTESPSATPLVRDPADARLQLFPDARLASYTTVEQRGVAAVRATRYGNPVSYTPEDRAANAIDGDPLTAWRVGAFSDVEGERIRVDLARATTIRSIRLQQPTNGPRNRFITTARIHLDDDTIDVELNDSLRGEGHVVTFPARDVTRVEVEVRETNVGKRARYDGLSGVGFAEVDIGADGGVRVDEMIRMPRDLTDALRRNGAGAATFVMTRQRSDPAVPVRSDEEVRLNRSFDVPIATEFTIDGSARLSAFVSDDVIDRLVATPGIRDGSPVARSDARLLGALHARAASAIDDDPDTAWSPGLLDQRGHWIEVETAAPITVDRLDLKVVADGRHSVPERLRIDVDGALGVRSIELPPIDDTDRAGATTAIPVTFEPVRGRTFRITIDGVRAVRTIDYFGDAPIDLPVAIAELGIPGVRGASPAGVDSACRGDLVTIDGTPVPVRIAGRTDAAIRRDALRVESCGALPLAEGDHELRTAIGRDEGIDIDRLVLRPAGASAAAPAAPPAIDTRATSRTSFDIDVEPSDDAAWLVLGQSHNLGWHASADGHDLGEPARVDGYANAWLLPPGTTSVRLEWTPQRAVWVGLAISAVAVMLCLGLIIAGRRATLAIAPDLAIDVGRSAPEAGRGRAAVSAVVCTAAAFALAGPIAAVAVAGVSIVGALHPFAAKLADVAPAMALGGAGAYVVAQQIRYDYPPDFAWPANLTLAHVLGWIAVVVVVQRAWVGSAIDASAGGGSQRLGNWDVSIPSTTEDG
jgi:hypothetical protein